MGACMGGACSSSKILAGDSSGNLVSPSRMKGYAVESNPADDAAAAAGENDGASSLPLPLPKNDKKKNGDADFMDGLTDIGDVRGEFVGDDKPVVESKERKAKANTNTNTNTNDDNEVEYEDEDMPGDSLQTEDHDMKSATAEDKLQEYKNNLKQKGVGTKKTKVVNKSLMMNSNAKAPGAGAGVNKSLMMNSDAKALGAGAGVDLSDGGISSGGGGSGSNGENIEEKRSDNDINQPVLSETTETMATSTLPLLAMGLGGEKRQMDEELKNLDFNLSDNNFAAKGSLAEKNERGGVNSGGVNDFDDNDLDF